MKNKRPPEIRRACGVHGQLESFDFIKRLVGVLRDLEHHQRWKYEQLSPVQLLETLKLNERRADKDELARAKYFWNRRPRLLPVISYVAWLVVAFGLPFWLLFVPAVGYPLVTISAVLVNTDIVRSVRWRRQYELPIDRLIQSSLGVRNFNG